MQRQNLRNTVAGQPLKRAQEIFDVERDSECRTVSVEDAGRILGLSRGSAYAAARDGTLPTIRFGKRLLVPKAALERLLASV
jgi:excisionase family DNA binding protein